MAKPISPAVIRRLPRYLHQLDELIEQGVMRVSSGQLAHMLALTASQVRQDFNVFGGFGQQGYGYHTNELRAVIADILRLNQGRTAILIGAGNLGRALCHNFDFAQAGFRLLAAFDVDLSLRDELALPLYHIDRLDSYIAQHKPDAAVLTLPKDSAPDMARRLADLGVRGLWNFTGVNLHATGIQQENVHFSDSLMTLCYYLEGS